MRTNARVLGGAVLAAMTIWVAAEDAWVLPRNEPSLKPGESTAFVTGQCSVCHSVDYIITQPPLPRATWQAIVMKMREKFGAPLPAEKVQEVVDYLDASYGRKAN